jgi:hypothetical protein
MLGADVVEDPQVRLVRHQLILLEAESVPPRPVNMS